MTNLRRLGDEEPIRAQRWEGGVDHTSIVGQILEARNVIFKSQIAVVRTSELIAPDENDTERPRLMRKMRQKG